MRRTFPAVVAVIGLLVAVGATSWTGAIEPQRGTGVLAGLRVGQPVALQDVGTAYEVRVLDEPFPTGEEIVEVGVDYLVVKSLAGVETRIPVTSIKAVIRVLTR